MCEAVENYAEQREENAKLSVLLDFTQKLMANMQLGADQVMNVLEVNDSDREILQKRL